MMGGTLEEKKETPLADTLDREEWMDKPQDEMTEDEKLKFREYEVREAKLKEEQEKIRKNLENELKKLKNEIVDICSKFDEQVLVLLRRKLEYDQRIYEQHLYQIRLILSILLEKEAGENLEELVKVIERFQSKEEEFQKLKDVLEYYRNDLEQTIKNTGENYNNCLEARQLRSNERLNFDANKIKTIYIDIFEEYKKDQKRKKDIQEYLENNPEKKNVLIPLDPFYEIEMAEQMNEWDNKFENFRDNIIEKIQIFQLINIEDQQSKDFIFQALKNKFQLKKDLDQYERESKDLNSFLIYFDNQFKEIQNTLQENEYNKRHLEDLLKEKKSNCEVLVRMKQGLVETSQDKLVPNYTNAQLIKRNIIEILNKEITNYGNSKVKSMEEIKKTKFEVAKAEFELQKKAFEIQLLEINMKEVHMLKVKKEMQIALTKKDTKLNEYEMKNLSDQIEKIKQTTEKRIQIYKKKEEKIKKDIDFILKENEQLLQQGSNLNSNKLSIFQTTVKQRKEISDMMFKKNTTSGYDENADMDSYEKFKKIAHNRQLFDLAKRQTEEIELLREELNKLKAKTFANFSSVNR